MKQTLILIAVIALLAVVIVTPSPAANATEARQYTVTLAITQTKDGKETTIASPTMILKDGAATSFLSGGEMPVDKDLAESVEYGTRAKITVRQKSAEKLLVSLDVSGDDLNVAPDGGFTLHRCGTQCVKTIKPGDSIYVDMGEGRRAKVAVLPIGK